MRPLTIKWNKRAFSDLIKAIQYIQRDSPQNAEKVKEEFFSIISKVAIHPGFFSPDKYKLNNDDSYCAFEMHHYRISYRVWENEIRILRVRHTKRNPKNH